MMHRYSKGGGGISGNASGSACCKPPGNLHLPPARLSPSAHVCTPVSTCRPDQCAGRKPGRTSRPFPCSRPLWTHIDWRAICRPLVPRGQFPELAGHHRSPMNASVSTGAIGTCDRHDCACSAQRANQPPVSCVFISTSAHRKATSRVALPGAGFLTRWHRACDEG